MLITFIFTQKDIVRPLNVLFHYKKRLTNCQAFFHMTSICLFKTPSCQSWRAIRGFISKHFPIRISAHPLPCAFSITLFLHFSLFLFRIHHRLEPFHFFRDYIAQSQHTNKVWNRHQSICNIRKVPYQLQRLCCPNIHNQ